MTIAKAQLGTNCKIHHLGLSSIGNCIIGDDCTIHAFVWIGDGVIIGDRVKIQAYAYIPVGVMIGDDVFISPRVTFTNDHKPPSYGKEWRNTLVKKGASIGAGAVILPGVIIGEHAKIGAGSVVTKNVPDNETWVGNPAKRL